MSSVKDEVICAQRRILDGLVDCEARIAATYEKFAVAFPAFADFWARLVREERQHVLALEKLHSFLARGHLFQNIGRFDSVKMQNLRDILDEADRSVTSAKIDASEAFALALKLEYSLMESHFYASVTSDAPEFLAVSKVLQAETEQHVSKLHAVVAKNTAPGAPFVDRN